MTAVIDIRELGDRPADRECVAALVAACSPDSLRRRFIMGGPAEPADVFRRYQRFLLAGSPALLATRGGVPVGLLNFVAETPGEAEIGILVADAWQRQGIGSALSRWLWAVGAVPGLDRAGHRAGRQRRGRGAVAAPGVPAGAHLRARRAGLRAGRAGLGYHDGRHEGGSR